MVTSLVAFYALLQEIVAETFDEEALAETRSVIEGLKGLARPQRRVIDDADTQRRAVALTRLEAEIANFDQRQRRAALVRVRGPHRIRGLAGSGKTVILAMKAANLHLNEPTERILVTFFTRSLRTSLRNLITRFFGSTKMKTRTGITLKFDTGGEEQERAGLDADACRRYGHVPLSLTEAQRAAAGKMDPFDFVCRDLLQKVKIEAYYDHEVIDEGQDFPNGFYDLCFALGERRQKTPNISYGHMTNYKTFLRIKIRSAEELFEKDTDGEPKISLERAARHLPPGTTNDTVLSKCYRNQRQVLVTAHALGFGIYGEIVQLLESPKHWHDVGYEVVSQGDFSVGEKVRILRPIENSPVSLDPEQAGKIIDWYSATTFGDEVNWIMKGIQEFIASGLQPEEIIVIALDDRHARMYLKHLFVKLTAIGVSTNNIIADPYTEPPFTLPGKVTLSTVYRAKGNEAAAVFALGVDAIPLRTRSGRNRLFTAFTRTKAWLRVSGIGAPASLIFGEIESALAHFPYLNSRCLISRRLI